MIEQLVSNKRCTSCREWRLVTDFHSEGFRNGKQQRCSKCKFCKNDIDRKKREAAGYARPVTASDRVIAELNAAGAGWRYPVEPARLRWVVGVAA